jgi:hypothetical protein
LSVLEPLVPFKDDPVDHRVFLHLDRHNTAIVADLDICEQFSREQVLQRLITRGLGVRLANCDPVGLDSSTRHFPSKIGC